MRALLLSAGLGTRLRPLTNKIPKPLVSIGGVTLLDRWINIARAMGCSDVSINVSYLAEKIVKHVAGEEGLLIIREEKPLGTAVTLRNWIRVNGTDSDLLVVHTDNLSAFDLGALKDVHINRGENKSATVMTFVTQDPSASGIFSFDGDRLAGYYEKSTEDHGNIANAGVYIFDSEALKTIMAGDSTDIARDVIPLLLPNLVLFHNDNYHRDIGTMEAYHAAIKEWEVR